MHIKDKIFMERKEFEKEGAITIVAFGDSVTHGAVGAGEINYETAYWNILRRKINNVRNYIPVNVINAGIGGASAKSSVERVDKQVLRYMPDLIIVCFGLNDINNTLEEYLSSLEIIFEKCTASGADVIFMTPNMLNTYVNPDTEEQYMKYAEVAAEYQNNGKMDLYISSAVMLARKMNVEVCDCYAQWKKISETEDTTKLLANHINHPTKEMHNLFADMLFDVIFGEEIKSSAKSDDTMYKENDK